VPAARLEGTHARIPAALVDDALRTAPRRFSLKPRPAAGHAADGEPGGLDLADGNSYFGTGSDCVYITDPDSEEWRQATENDVEGMAALAEQLPNIDFVMSMGLPSDVPAQAGDPAQYAAMLAGTRKSLLTMAHDAASLRRRCDMAAMCGETRSFGCYAMPNPPLVHSAEALDKVQACAELDAPLVYAPAPAVGSTAPASIAAMIAVGNAETLGGLVVHQITKAGVPFVYGAGYLESGIQSSYETIVLGNELVSCARALLVEVGDDEALALNEIDAVGRDGSHLGRDHTGRHHRETWAPTLFDRAACERWHAAGATTLKERVHLQTEALRREPRAFALEGSVRERLSATLADAGRNGA